MTQQANPSENFTSVSASVPAVVACIAVRRSDSIRGNTTWVSGSPNRQLYSMTLGPSLVSIRPKYKHPVKGRPSAAMARMVGRKISSIHSRATCGV